MSLINRRLGTPSRYSAQPLSLFNDPFFRDVMELDFPSTSLNAFPKLDLIEKNDSFLLKADLPGYKKDQISMDIEGNNLVLRGQAEEEKEERDANYHHRERSTRSFQRVIPLASTIDPKKIKAVMKEGILEVQIPKDVAKSNVARINIQ